MTISESRVRSLAHSVRRLGVMVPLIGLAIVTAGIVASTSWAQQRGRQAPVFTPQPQRALPSPRANPPPQTFNRPSATAPAFRAPTARPAITQQERAAKVVNLNVVRERIRTQAVQAATAQRARIQATQAIIATRAALGARPVVQPTTTSGGRPPIAANSNVSARLAALVAKYRTAGAAGSGGARPPSGSGGSGGNPPASLRSEFMPAASRIGGVTAQRVTRLTPSVAVGISGFSRALGGRRPEQSIWTAGKPPRNSNVTWLPENKMTPAASVVYHWHNHKREFPHFANAREYADAAWRISISPPKDFLPLRQRKNKDWVTFNPKTNIMVVTTMDGVPRTMFEVAPQSAEKPRGYPNKFRSAQEYYESQFE